MFSQQLPSPNTNLLSPPSSCTVGSVPMYEALERADGDVEKIDWPMFRKVLIDQAEQVCARRRGGFLFSSRDSGSPHHTLTHSTPGSGTCPGFSETRNSLLRPGSLPHLTWCAPHPGCCKRARSAPPQAVDEPCLTVLHPGHPSRRTHLPSNTHARPYLLPSQVLIRKMSG